MRIISLFVAPVCAALVLSACGGDSSSVAPATSVPTAPTGLLMGFGVKSFNLFWDPVPVSPGGAPVVYQVFEDLDGAGPETPTLISGRISANNYTHVIDGLLHTRLHAQYLVEACNSAGCSAASAVLTPNLTYAIGYFKASNTNLNDRFGQQVAISADGSTLAVSAYFEASNATGIDGDQANNAAAEAGAVYVYTQSSGVWRQQAYVKASNAERNDLFGYSVALSADGNTLAVGAQMESSNATGIDGDQLSNTAAGAGAAYVFTRSGTTWAQQAYVKASNTYANNHFGDSVTISADGNTLVVGAQQENSNATGVNGDQLNIAATSAGAAYVFTRSGTTWSQQAYLKASNASALDRFGRSLGLSADGDTLAVGAINERSAATGIDGDQSSNAAVQAGAVYVFTRSGTIWSQQAYVKASNTQALDLFGNSVAVSSDGNTLAIGAFGEASNATGIDGDQTNNSASGSGAVYVFTRAGITWSQQAYVKASNPQTNDYFGSSLALSGDGNTLAVGSPREASNATGIDGDQTNDRADEAGAAYVFNRRGGTTWSQKAYVKAPNSGFDDGFGVSLSLTRDGKTMAVGAYGEDSSATGIDGSQTDNSARFAGAAYVY